MSVTIGDGVVLTVEVGFSTSAGAGRLPYDALWSSIVWTDVSNYVQSVTIRRGRSKELDSFQTGAASIVLDNRDRRFDPDHATGPYYGSLTPLRPVRVSANYGTSTLTYNSANNYDNSYSYDTGYALFTGFVEGWPQTYDPPRNATVTIACSDAFKPLNLNTLPSYWFGSIGSRAIRLNEPTGSSYAAYTFGDSTVDATFGTWKAFSGGAPTTSVGADALIVNDSSTASAFDGTRYVSKTPTGFVDLVSVGYIEPFPYTSAIPEYPSGWMSSTMTTTGRYGIAWCGVPGWPAVGMVVTASGAGYLEATGQQAGYETSMPVWRSSVIVNDGQPHHFTFVDVGDGLFSPDVRLVVDGEIATDYRGGSLNAGLIEEGTIGGVILHSATTFDFGVFTGSIQDIYNGIASTTAAAARLWRIGRGVFGAGQKTGQRVKEILDFAKWPSDARAIDNGTSTVQAPNIEGKTALAYIKTLEASEQGRFYIDGAGKVKFESRRSILTSGSYTSPQAVFGDDPSAGELGYTDLKPVYDDQLIKNIVSVSRENDVTVTVRDNTSIGQYLERSDSVTGLLNDSQQTVVDFANARLATYKQPQPRVEAITVDARQNPTALYPLVLGFDIGTRITVKRRPQGVGTAISRDAVIEGISHTIGPKKWTTTWSLSPATATDYLVLNNTTLGKLDTGKLAY